MQKDTMRQFVSENEQSSRISDLKEKIRKQKEMFRKSREVMEKVKFENEEFRSKFVGVMSDY